MILLIWKNQNGLYEARAAQPQTGVFWMTHEGLPLDKLVLELRKQGCSQQEINDALHEMTNRPDVMRRTGNDNNNAAWVDPGCFGLLADLGCGCLSATSVLVVTAGAGFYFVVSKFMGWA